MEILLGTLFAIVCVLLVVVVLLQKGRGGGLGAAFGGAASSAFGTRVGDVLTWVTVALVALFLLLAVVVVVSFRPPGGQVAAPKLDPPSSITDEEVVVTISCHTPGAFIYYTIDGAEPDENSRRYISTLTVAPGTTLMAKAFRAGMDPSNTQTGYYGSAVGESIPGVGFDVIERPADIAIPAPEADAIPAGNAIDANVVAD